MIHLHVLAFRLGQASPELISNAYIDFYLWLSRKVTGLTHELVPKTTQEAIPLPNETIQTASSQIYPILLSSLDKAPPTVKTVLIDLNNPAGGIARGTLVVHLAFAIGYWYKQNENTSQSSVKTIILIPDIPPEGDEVRKQLERLANDGKVIFIDDDGKSYPNIKALDPSRFLFNQIQARGDQLELLQKKIIKRHGHFQREQNGSKYCVPYFYDGRFCESETAFLFEKFVLERVAELKSEHPAIAYHGRISDWLQNAAVAVAERNNFRSFDLNSDSEGWEPLEQINPSVVFLLLDMIDTGKTTIDLLNRLFSLKLDVKLAVFTVLSTKTNDEKKSNRIISLNDRSIDVKCLYEVRQTKLFDNECEMCGLNLPHNKDLEEKDEEEPYCITAYQMWNMAEQAGTQTEDSIPTYRPGLHNVPRFPEIIRDNAAWIVHKFRQYLQSMDKECPADAVLLCAEDPGAEVLAEHIKLMLGFSTIMIPRNIVDEFALKLRDKTNIRPDIPKEWETSRWYIELSAAGAAEIILLDVFNVTGSTLETLFSLADRLLKKPTTCLLFTDLNPSVTAQLQCKVISLYSLQSATLEKGITDE